MNSKKNFNFRVVDMMQFFCRELEYYKVLSFCHDITFGEGKVAMLCSDNKMLSYYLKNEIALICTNHQGRMLPAGSYINKTLIDRYSDCAQLFPKIFNAFEFNNTFSIVERETDCQHFYTFSFNLNDSDFIQHLINNISYFDNFIHQYKQAAKDIIKEAKNPKNHLELPISSNIEKIENSIITSNEKIEEFNSDLMKLKHKDTKKILKISVQQSKCLTLLMKGWPVKKIAGVMELSPRTVENYIINIRKKLNCKNTRELISYYIGQIVSKD